MNRIAVDTETTGLNKWIGHRPFAVSMCDQKGKTRYWEWPVHPISRNPQIPEKDKQEIREIVGDIDLVKVFFNGKFDTLMLDAIGIGVKGEIAEVSFMARAVNNLEPTFALKPLAKKYLKIPDEDQKALHRLTVKARRVGKKLGWNLGPVVVTDYWMPTAIRLMMDGHLLYRLWRKKVLKDESLLTYVNSFLETANFELCETYAVIDAERTIGLDEFYRYGMEELEVEKTYQREMELLPLTISMEKHGVAIDMQRVKELKKKALRKRKKALKVLVDASKKEDFNPNSPKQVVKLLFEGQPLKLPILERTKKNQPCTGGKHLLPYQHNPVVEALLGFKSNEKALSSFFNKYGELAVVDEIGQSILHPGYRQCGTLTGRYSCSEPNLQQISDPTTTSSLLPQYVINIREVFIPRKGYMWYCPDYSQLEVLIFAHISGEESLLKAIRNGVDVHTATTNKCYGINKGKDVTLENLMKIMDKPDKVKARELLCQYEWDISKAEDLGLGKKVYRKLSKAVTFAKIFGGGPKALMQWLGMGYDEAVKTINRYDVEYPDIVDKINDLALADLGAKQGYVINPYGRRLQIDRWYSFRAANYLVQSSAADLMKIGMVKCNDYLKSTGLDARIIMTIHDELIFEFREGDNFKSVLRGICDRMSDHGGVFCVDTPVDIDKVTTRWSQKEKITLCA